jgi:hypothetical protein
VILILSGAGVMLGGLLVLLAMVIRLIEPSLALSLLSYATTFVGMLLGMMGATQYAQRRRR